MAEGWREPETVMELIRTLRERGISEEEYAFHVGRFLEMKSRRLGIPLTGQFELTPFCNLDCKMCYVHLDYHQYNKDDLLPVETWKSLIRQAHQKGMMQASLTGGECLTYPGFEEVYRYLYEMGIAPGILTNGVLVDERCLHLFEKYPPKMIQVTMYGSSEDAYERVTGRRVFQTVWDNTVRLKDRKMPVRIAVTPNRYMEEDIRTWFEKLKTLGIPYFVNANLIPPRKNTGRITEDVPVDRYVEIYKIQSMLDEQKLAAIDPVELPDEGRGGERRYGMVCGAGRSSFGITYEGKLCPCLSLGEITSDPMELGFESAWKEIHHKAEHFPVPQEWGGCVFYDRCLRCVAMHKNAPQEGHCDPRICERTKKLIRAGFVPLPGRESMQQAASQGHDGACRAGTSLHRHE